MMANFFLAGAPKSGTTSLARSLGHHPDIFLPYVKEPHFFGSDTGQETSSANDYSALFADAGPARFRMDASTHTLRSVDAIEQVLDLVPDARFIILLRDPVEAVPAFHGQLLRHFVEPETDFATAWALQEARSIGAAKGPLYHPVYDYGRQIKRLVTLVPEAQRRIYTFKALQADGEGLIQDILGFLEIEQIPLSLSHDNPNAEFRSRALHRQKQRLAPKVRRLKAMLGVRKNLGLGRLLTGWNSKKTARAAISPELVAELRDVFREDYETVKSITGFDIRDSTASFKKNQ